MNSYDQGTHFILGVIQHNQGRDHFTDLWCFNKPELPCIEVQDHEGATAGVGIYANWQEDNTAVCSEIYGVPVMVRTSMGGRVSDCPATDSNSGGPYRSPRRLFAVYEYFYARR